jgi:hypothetical protein
LNKIKKTGIKEGDTSESIFEKFYDFFRTIPHEKLNIIPFGWFSMWLTHNGMSYPLDTLITRHYLMFCWRKETGKNSNLLKRIIMLRSCIIILLILSAITSHGQPIQSERYRKQLNEAYTSGLFNSDDAYMIVPDNDISSSAYLNVFQYLQGRVPGLLIYNADRFGTFPSVSYRRGRPAFFLDEMRVDLNALNNLSLPDIALIKVFRSPFFGAIGGGPNGAIAVYTKRGDEE